MIIRQQNKYEKQDRRNKQVTEKENNFLKRIFIIENIIYMQESIISRSVIDMYHSDQNHLHFY
jgi:hypothetical protein